jgi:hypothetical protein
LTTTASARSATLVIAWSNTLRMAVVWSFFSFQMKTNRYRLACAALSSAAMPPPVASVASGTALLLLAAGVTAFFSATAAGPPELSTLLATAIEMPTTATKETIATIIVDFFIASSPW